MSETDPLEEYFEQRNAKNAAKVKAQKELIAASIASPAYQSELKFIERMTSDIFILLRLCLMYSGRAGKYSENSLTIRSRHGYLVCRQNVVLMRTTHISLLNILMEYHFCCQMVASANAVQTYSKT
ncbi:MAG: hypothetical protein RLZZ148_1233 [Cyanobacteriota bacterium]